MQKNIIVRPLTSYALLKPLSTIIIGFILVILLKLALFYYSQYFPKQDYYTNIAELISYLIGILFILKYLYKVILIKSYKYKLTDDRLDYTRGVFSLKKDYLELYRVKDYAESRPFLLRVIKGMVITLITSDRSHETLVISGIPKSNLIDIIRHYVELNRKLKGVYEID